MKKVFLFIVIALLLISFLSFVVARDAIRLTTGAINNACTDSDEGKDYSVKGTVTTDSETQTDSCAQCTGACLEDEPNCGYTCGAVLEFYCEGNEIKNETHDCINTGCEEGACITKGDDKDETECEAWTCTQWSACLNNVKTRICSKTENCTSEQEKPKLTKTCIGKEKLNIKKSTDCPEKCTCTGSVVKCTLANGTREMTITAGKSGNIIVQVKGVNASTKVVLYKNEEGKLYGVFKNNETKQVKMLPDQVKEKIREKLAKQLENEEIKLNEDGKYEYQGKDKAKLFAFIPVKLMVRAELNPETGEVIKLKKPWWAFLAKEDTENLIVGAGCGTVSPDSRNECCKTKGYDLYDLEKGECVFSSE